eukprot:CAMPEP_0195518626 /NCGR_PEP_ID=MMETSP0794_2-20130614/13355_1 /TAXON_ID=515487 /ORGANISM="Stephanopyxis turris, Strain CCMP 815" /LENGTH=142 /DNA_ID=CAMNT_0040647633 /DNA_START=93 /DNA_END=518 /DNA_ORIENTATION=+
MTMKTFLGIIFPTILSLLIHGNPSLAFTTAKLFFGKSSTQHRQQPWPQQASLIHRSPLEINDHLKERATARTNSPVRLWGEEKNSRNDETYGMKTGAKLMAFVLAINVWQFSIPPELRRVKFCTAQQVADNPGSKCVTFENW